MSKDLIRIPQNYQPIIHVLDGEIVLEKEEVLKKILEDLFEDLFLLRKGVNEDS